MEENMKKEWIRPLTEVQLFVANEYVAACGDENRVYNFECNAGSKSRSYNVYLNGPDGVAHTADDIDWSLQRGGNWYVRTYSPCGETHQAKVDSDFQTGYMYEYFYGQDRGNPIPVIVWTNNRTNTHCTTNLDIDSWTTAKS